MLQIYAVAGGAPYSPSYGSCWFGGARGQQPPTQVRESTHWLTRGVLGLSSWRVGKLAGKETVLLGNAKGAHLPYSN